MKSKDLLVSVLGNIKLEYRICGNCITVTKTTPNGKTSVKIKTKHTGDRARIICGRLWAARATPYTAAELAQDAEI